MSKLLIRKTLKQFGLLEGARRWKKRFVATENEFKPADPRTLISTLRCIDCLQETQSFAESDYLEFGIYRGFNLWWAQAYARLKNVRDVRFFGFDSFVGIPAVNGVDAGGAFKEGDFSAYKDEVELWLTRFGVDWTRTHLIDGFFDQTLNPGLYKQHSLRRCALSVVDCDLYSSTVPVLRFVRPLLAENSIIYFDDWDDFGASQEKGEPLAFREFCCEATEFKFAELDVRSGGGKGKAFIVTSVSR